MADGDRGGNDKAINCYYYGGEEEFILSSVKVIFNKIGREDMFSAKSALQLCSISFFFLLHSLVSNPTKDYF